ncbi:MAG: phosphoglucomutase/phosphomannomutase PgmG [Novosphingobium sp.]
MKSHRFDPAILREYDVRGEVGRQLGVHDAEALGRGFATVLREAGGNKVVVGRDGRLSSPELEAALVHGLLAGGVDVVRIGLGPTPMLYFAEASMEQVKGGIQVTGSHNPADHNGFKMVLGGRPFCGEALRELGRRATLGDWSVGQGRCEEREILGTYVERLGAALQGLDRAALGALRIGWDAGNGAAGPALERLIENLPGEHHALFTHVDGTFPHHHPDPTVEANLADLKALVAAKSLDFGVAFDGDGDRIVVVDAKGRVLWGDQLLMILAEDLLVRAPGSTVIADVKASQVLFDRVTALGGRAVMGKTGHSLIKSEMKRIGAPLGGEMTGHLMFADDWYGFDDALYAALRLIAATQRLGRSLTQLRDAMPEPCNTPELRIPVREARKFAVVAEVAARLALTDAAVVTIDGVRVSTADGWWLLRASNTQDALTLRAESASQAGLARLLALADAQLALSGIARV